MTFLSNRLHYHQITPDVQCNTSGYTSVCTHQVGSAGLPSASKGRHWTWDRDGMDGKTGRVTDGNVTTHNCSPLYCVSPGDGSQAGRLSSELLSWWNIFLAQAGFYHFLFSVCVCMHTPVHAFACASEWASPVTPCGRQRTVFWEFTLFYYVGSRNRTQVLRRESKRLYPQNHLPCL